MYTAGQAGRSKGGITHHLRLVLRSEPAHVGSCVMQPCGSQCIQPLLSLPWCFEARGLSFAGTGFVWQRLAGMRARHGHKPLAPVETNGRRLPTEVTPTVMAKQVNELLNEQELNHMVCDSKRANLWEQWAPGFNQCGIAEAAADAAPGSVACKARLEPGPSTETCPTAAPGGG